MSGFHLHGWLDLSTSQKPSYALVLRHAAGDAGDKLVKYRETWMTAKAARVLKFANRDTARIDHSPVIPKAPIAVDESPSITAPPTSLPASPEFPAMRLPPELRRVVLEFDAAEFLQSNRRGSQIAVYLRGLYGSPTAIPLPPVTKAGSRQLRLESIHATLNTATLEIHSGPANAKLQRWLSSIDLTCSGTGNLSKGFDAVHSLLFPYFSRFPHHLPSITANNDIELMKRCGNLRSVSVQWVSSELSDYNGVPKAVDQLRTEYRLDGMLELARLETLTLNGPGTGSASHTALHNLAKWFEAEFKERDRTTQVVLM